MLICCNQSRKLDYSNYYCISLKKIYVWASEILLKYVMRIIRNADRKINNQKLAHETIHI